MSQSLVHLSASELRELCLRLGADDVGFVSMDDPAVADQREEIWAHFPGARSLISFVCRMNREPVRSPARSLANAEFHMMGDKVNHVAHDIAAALERRGIRALNEATFPMEMDRFPGKTWIISHKPIAVAAGLGQMGLHRNLIHPRFGNFVLLGTVLVDAEISAYQQPIDYNPCVSCKLCVAACPVGAVQADGHFDFSACYTHNYREFLGGFSDWVETVVDSPSPKAYRQRVSASETASMWQSLGFGPNYKAAYCLAVCPAGEEVMPPFQADRAQFLRTTLKPLQQKQETLYVVAGSDAEAYARKRYPHKPRKRVHNGLRPVSIAAFLSSLRHVFQRGQAQGLDAVYHFVFTGAEPAQATIVLRGQTCQVELGLQGKADLRIQADSKTWLRFLSQEASLPLALLSGRIRLRGNPRLLAQFGACFPA